MNDNTLMFAAIFLVSITVICAGVVAVAFNRVGTGSKGRVPKRRTRYAHRAFKDVM